MILFKLKGKKRFMRISVIERRIYGEPELYLASPKGYSLRSYKMSEFIDQLESMKYVDEIKDYSSVNLLFYTDKNNFYQVIDVSRNGKDLMIQKMNDLNKQCFECSIKDFIGSIQYIF